MSIAAGSADIGYVMFALTAGALVGFVAYHLSRHPSLSAAPAAALMVGGAAAWGGTQAAFTVLEKLHLLS